jgi:hypothetical protein
VFSISGKVDNSVKQMGRLLSEIKGGGQGQAISKSGNTFMVSAQYACDLHSRVNDSAVQVTAEPKS